VGDYSTKAGDAEIMAATERNGHWAQAVQLRLPANAAADPQALMDSVSCTGSSCVAGGLSGHAGRLRCVRGHGRPRPLAPGGRGGAACAWAARTNPEAALDDIACLRTSCIAAGVYSTAVPNAEAMVAAGKT
jgi:hypothetical protein